MRLAFVDLVFSWPPLGGAPADLFYTIDGLQRLGHDVHLFYVTDPERDDHGSLDHSEFPFDATRLDYTEDEYTPARVPREIRAAVDKWAPDVVFVCFGFFIKPFVAEALADYPTISRYYAYEPACPRDIRIYKNAATCPKNYLDTPDECRRCTLSFLSAEIRRFHPLGYAREYLETKAYSTAYYRSMLDSIKSFDAIIVYNEIAKVHFAGHHDNVKVIGGGVRLEDFAFSPVPERAAGEKKIILMTGRTEDPSKGMKVMRAAGEELWKSRDDFEMWFTQSGDEYREPWVKNIGWHDHTGIVDLYTEADICVAPSIWEEPFGLVAVEAMAAGRPVCVARVGGLQAIPVHGKSGFVYDRHDSGALAAHLGELLDNGERRREMGKVARKRVEEKFSWEKVIEQNYPALLESVLS